MKKLNKTELDALATRINRELKQEAEIAQKELDEMSHEKNVAKASIIFDEIRGLSPATLKYIDTTSRSYNNKMTFDDIVKSLKETQTKVTVYDKWNSNVFESLVLAQIEANTISELIDSVKGSFIKP